MQFCTRTIYRAENPTQKEAHRNREQIIDVAAFGKFHPAGCHVQQQFPVVSGWLSRLPVHT
jgi:hypothetical protein